MIQHFSSRDEWSLKDLLLCGGNTICNSTNTNGHGVINYYLCCIIFYASRENEQQKTPFSLSSLSELISSTKTVIFAKKQWKAIKLFY